jgi:hypothetical protein
MTEKMTNTFFGQSPKRFGIASLVAACLAFASWPLMVVIGFLMVYVAMLMSLVAVVSGLLGISSGIYFKEWPGVVMGTIGIGLVSVGACFIVSALSNF